MDDFQKTQLLGINQGVQMHKPPISLSQAAAIVESMLGQYRLMASIMLNCGLHPRECIHLRTRHFQREKNRLIVPNAAGFNVRSSFVPIVVHQALVEHIEYLKKLHADDLRYGFGQVRLPDSFAGADGEYSNEFGWQWLFSRRSLTLEANSINREDLILEILKRRINQAAECLHGSARFNVNLLDDELEVDVFWKSYLASIDD